MQKLNEGAELAESERFVVFIATSTACVRAAVLAKIFVRKRWSGAGTVSCSAAACLSRSRPYLWSERGCNRVTQFLPRKNK